VTVLTRISFPTPADQTDCPEPPLPGIRNSTACSTGTIISGVESFSLAIAARDDGLDAIAAAD
jgi:hypothetical protein